MKQLIIICDLCHKEIKTGYSRIVIQDHCTDKITLDHDICPKCERRIADLFLNKNTGEPNYNA